MNKKINNKELYYLSLLSIFAFAINFYVASNGVYPVDTFIHYDNGYRILLGDNPIKDYWIVHGLVIDYIQAIFFYIFGNNWNSYLIHSSVFNALITIFSYHILKKLKIEYKYVILIAISISLLAYPVSGSPFLDLHSSFFSLFAFYFAILSVLKKKNYMWGLASFFLCLAFFSKQVPAAYSIVCLSLLNLFFVFNTRNVKIFFYYIAGVLVFLFLFFLILNLRGIKIEEVILQIFLFPQSIGIDRYSTYLLEFKNTILDYKFIHLPLFAIVIINILFLKRNKLYYKSSNFKIFLIITFFTLSSIFHQIYTKNQIYIFFLIPILTGLLIHFVNLSDLKRKDIITYIFLILCFFSTIKYYERFNLDRKFHELANVNKDNSIKLNLFNNKFKNLNWISPYFENPNEEIENIRILYEILKKDKTNKMLISEYNFFSSLLEEKLHSPSRTYDSISFPKKNTKYFIKYKTFFLEKILSNKIKNIYIFEPKIIDKNRINHLIFDYISEDCFEIDNINLLIKRLKIKKCKDLRS